MNKSPPFAFFLTAIILIESSLHSNAKYRKGSLKELFMKKLENNETLGVFQELKKLTDKIKDDIVHKHNELREIVAAGLETRGKNGKGPPPAQNMQQMVWDDYAAKQAATLAKKCWFDHIIHKDEDGKVMGQNLAYEQTTGTYSIDEYIDKSMIMLIQSWYDEVALWDYDGGTFTGAGHFTQMIWADSWKVGCAIALCIPNEGGTALYLVCDYKPAGNIRGRSPYVAGGQNCTGFKLNPPGEYKHLCENSCCPTIFSKHPLINNILLYIVIIHFTTLVT